MLATYVVMIKLFLASMAGLILGLEREGKHKALGLRTCVVISVTSCLLTVISIEFALSSYKGIISTGSDPMRLPAQIVSGIGFLGAGVIVQRSNNVIYGLTTAAIVWTAAGFGIAIGAGFYFEVALGIGLIHFAVNFLPYIMREIGPPTLKEQVVYLRVYVEFDTSIQEVIDETERLVVSLENVKIKGLNEGHRIDMRCFIHDSKGSISYQYEEIRKIEGVKQLEITKT